MSRGPNPSRRGAGVGTSEGQGWAKTCGRCRRTFDASGWFGLKAVGKLERAEIQAHLVVPAPERIELRACACGAVLAAKPPVEPLE